ncbi:NnrU family protein [Roseovarius pelagicus]|uniref:NnrU family protein n=1 Tax=Roseovarius pelagicus TaxID=2980108 RepID=A0ABY6DG50_9RHOB|nr:NnrU family protein [Roseovarius pelagicus]UXX85126.1 NnrU family protein [Roseovarius pelagicus]
MILLIVGLALWIGAHLFKRMAPARRAAMGAKGRGPIALTILAGVVLMVLGYRMADGAVYWGRSPAMVGINNLLMLLSIYLFAVSGAKTALARRMRHPMLTAVKVWALAHLLVNGDVPSFVLFGGLMAWAVIEVIVINRSERDWTPPPPAPRRKEITTVIATLIVYAGIAGVHYALGYPTFG